MYENIVPFTGASIRPGHAYHDIPGVDGPTHRTGTAARVKHITHHLDVDGLTGIDLGCNVGGITLGLAEHGATMTGIDHDARSIAVGTKIAATRQLPCTFSAADIGDGVVWDGILAGGYDFAIWLSNWMWIAKQIGRTSAEARLGSLADAVPTLVFETAESPSTSSAGSGGIRNVTGVNNLLAVHYKNVTNIGAPPDGWYGRSVFICTQ